MQISRGKIEHIRSIKSYGLDNNEYLKGLTVCALIREISCYGVCISDSELRKSDLVDIYMVVDKQVCRKYSI